MEYDGKNFFIHLDDGILRLVNLGIKRISEIKGMEDIIYLKMLRLRLIKLVFLLRSTEYITQYFMK